MENYLMGIAAHFWPELDTYNPSRRMVAVGDVIALLWSLPLAVAGFVWLIGETRWALFNEHWESLLLLSALLLVFDRLSYFLIIEIRTDRYGSADGSLASMVQWTAVFLFGPSALWILVLLRMGSALNDWIKTNSKAAHWAQARSLTHEIASITLGGLTALVFYQHWGGVYPIPGLTLPAILAAFGALASACD